MHRIIRDACKDQHYAHLLTEFDRSATRGTRKRRLWKSLFKLHGSLQSQNKAVRKSSPPVIPMAQVLLSVLPDSPHVFMYPGCPPTMPRWHPLSAERLTRKEERHDPETNGSFPIAMVPASGLNLSVKSFAAVLDLLPLLLADSF